MICAKRTAYTLSQRRGNITTLNLAKQGLCPPQPPNLPSLIYYIPTRVHSANPDQWHLPFPHSQYHTKEMHLTGAIEQEMAKSSQVWVSGGRRPKVKDIGAFLSDMNSV